METTPDHARRIESLVRTGTVSEVDGKRVRIKTGGNETDWLPWPATSAGHARTWNPPKVGEQVTLLAESGELSTARIVPGLNSDDIEPPSTGPNTPTTTYPDGATIAYNWETGTLTATGIQSATIQASGSCTVDCPEVTATGNLTVQGNLTIQGTADFTGLATFNGGTMGDRV